MSNNNNLLIVTSALPYANGPLHFGHLLEHIQTDIWVRTNRSLNKECIYLCASDAHGTPIMLKAEEENTTPEILIKKITTEQKQSLVNFNIVHDNYYTTHSEENKYFSELIFNKADTKKLILRKDHRKVNKIIFVFFTISVSLILFGLLTESENFQKYIGFGVLILFFIVFPLFSYHRWKDKKMDDYYLNSENLKKFRENSDL